MEYLDQIAWRLRVQTASHMKPSGCEFIRTGGRYVLTDWRAHPYDPGAPQIVTERTVNTRFDSIAERSAWTAEIYYHELSNPTPGFFKSNVIAAMGVSSASFRMAADWIEQCTASDEIVEEMFVLVREAIGETAKAQTKLHESQIEQISEEVARGIFQARRKARCVRTRLVA